MFSRRRFLRGSTLTAVGALGFPHLGQSASFFNFKKEQRPKHIIHLVADGMSMGTLTCADYFSHLTRGRGLSFVEQFKNPLSHQGWMNMRSLNSMVTDSAAASSSWGSGSRIINGSINLLPDGRPLKTLYELFGAQGWKRGLVTTTEITHATPAGFAANVNDRDTGTMIATQYLDRRIDVLLGGGEKFFNAGARKDKRDLKGEFRRAGYNVMETATELKSAATDQRWLGLFAKSHLPFTIDHRNDPLLLARVPTLAEMTRSALGWLQRHDHFILQVEGGMVDHACHNCDAPSALRDMVAFDEAIDACLEFRKQQPDTLVIITTDHGNGNMGANGTGDAYGQSSWMFRHTADLKASFPQIMKHLRKKPVADDENVEKKSEDADEGGFNATQAAKSKAAGAEDEQKAAAVEPKPKPPESGAKGADKNTGLNKKKDKPKEIIVTPAEAVQVIYDYTGYKPSERRVGLLLTYLQKKGTPLYELMNNDMAQLGQLLGNRLGIGWTGNAHTADFVPILAVGPGAEKFAGFIQNVDVFQHYTNLAGIDYKNPEEPLIAHGGPTAASVENTDEYAKA